MLAMKIDSSKSESGFTGEELLELLPKENISVLEASKKIQKLCAEHFEFYFFNIRAYFERFWKARNQHIFENFKIHEKLREYVDSRIAIVTPLKIKCGVCGNFLPLVKETKTCPPPLILDVEIAKKQQQLDLEQDCIFCNYLQKLLKTTITEIYNGGGRTDKTG